MKGLDLISISLKEAKCNLNSEIKLPDQLIMEINSDEKLKMVKEEQVQIIQKYSLDARKRNSKLLFLKIDLTFMITLRSKEKFTDEFFDVYKEVSLKLNTWPYFREFVNNITLRMNIPFLIISLFKVN